MSYNKRLQYLGLESRITTFAFGSDICYKIVFGACNLNFSYYFKIQLGSCY